MRRGGHLVARPSNGRALVELDQGGGCARCARGRGCGAALFAPRPAPLRLDCEVPERLAGANVRDGASAAVDGPLASGSRVTVEIDTTGSAWLRPVLLAYALPTLGLLGGAFAPEPWTPLASIAGLAGGLLAWRVLAAHDADEPSLTASLVAGPPPCGARLAVAEHTSSTGETS